jgi:hypothetical protein
LKAPAADAASHLRNLAGQQVQFHLLAGLSAALSMKSCPIIAVIGTITAVGPNALDNAGVTYPYLEICGPQRVDFEAMRAYVRQRGGRDAQG